MKKFYFITILIVILLSCFSCSDDKNTVISVKIPDTNVWVGIDENSPAMANVESVFSLVIVGNKYNNTFDEQISFVDTSATIAIALEDYESGKCTIQIKNDGDDVLFSRELTGNLAYANVSEFDDIPGELIVTFENFTGNLSFALTGQGEETN